MTLEGGGNPTKTFCGELRTKISTGKSEGKINLDESELIKVDACLCDRLGHFAGFNRGPESLQGIADFLNHTPNQSAISWRIQHYA
jgi:hypothetical protein